MMLYHARYGRLDFFKKSECQNLEAFPRTLSSSEDRITAMDYRSENTTAIVQDHTKSTPSSLGMLRDCLDWLWDHIVLAVTPASKQRYDAQWDECHLRHHLHISHLSFEVVSRMYRKDEKHQVGDEYFEATLRHCAFLTSHLHIRTPQIFIMLTPEQAEKLIRKKGNLRWVNAIGLLPVKEQFSFGLVIIDWWAHVGPSTSHSELNRLRDLANAVLEEKLMPMSLWGRKTEDEGELA